MIQGLLSSALLLFGISYHLQSICAYNIADSYDTGASCYDCQYAPHDVHKEPRAPYIVNHYSGFHRCALEQEDDAFYVNKWTCQSERCFIRRDPNGQIFRGCADQWNLPWGVDTNQNCSQQGQSDAIWWFCDGHLCNDGFLHDSARCGNKAMEEEPTPEVQEEDAVAMPLYSAADQPEPEGGYYDYEQEVDPTPSAYPTPVPHQVPTHRVEYPVGNQQDSSYQEPGEYVNVIDSETVHGITFYDNFRDVEENMPMAPQAVYQNDPKPARPQFHHVNSQVKHDSGSYSDHRASAQVHHETAAHQGYGDVRPPKYHPSVYDQGGHQHPHTPDHGAAAPHPHTPNHGAPAPHPHTPNHGAAAPHPHTPDHGAAAPHPHTPNHGAPAPHPHTPDHGAPAPHPHTPDHGAAVPHPHTPDHGAPAPYPHTHGHGAAVPHPHTPDHGAARYSAPHFHPPTHPQKPPPQQQHPVQAPRDFNEEKTDISSVLPPHAFVLSGRESFEGGVEKSHQGAFHGHGQVHTGKSQKSGYVQGGSSLPKHQEGGVEKSHQGAFHGHGQVHTGKSQKSGYVQGGSSLPKHQEGGVEKSHQGAFHGHGQDHTGKSQKSGYVQGGSSLPKHQKAFHNHEATETVKLPIFPHSHAGTPRAKSATLGHGSGGKGQAQGQLRIIDHGGLLPSPGKQSNEGYNLKSGQRRGGIGTGSYGAHSNHNREPFWMWWWHSGAFQRMNPQQAYVQYLYNRVMTGQANKGSTYTQDDGVKNPKSNTGYRVQQASYQRSPIGGRQRNYAPIRSNIYYSRITSKKRPRLPMPWAGQKARKSATKPHDHGVKSHEDTAKGYEGLPTRSAKTVDPLDYKSFKPLYTHAIREPLGPVADHPDPEPEGDEEYAAENTEAAKDTLEVVLDEHVEEAGGHGHGDEGGTTGVTAKSLSKKDFYHYYDNLKLHRPTGRARGHVQSTDDYNPCGMDCSNFKNPGSLYKDPSNGDRFIQCGPGTVHGQACRCCSPFYHFCPKGTTFDDLQKVCNQGGSSIVEDKDYKTLDLYADYK